LLGVTGGTSGGARNMAACIFYEPCVELELEATKFGNTDLIKSIKI
jgi:hypothetical protein